MLDRLIFLIDEYFLIQEKLNLIFFKNSSSFILKIFLDLNIFSNSFNSLSFEILFIPDIFFKYFFVYRDHAVDYYNLKKTLYISILSSNPLLFYSHISYKFNFSIF